MLLASKTPIVVADAAIAKKSLLMTTEDVKKRLSGLHAAAPLLVSDFEAWMGKHSDIAQQVTGSSTHWPIWDEATTAYLLGFATAETKPRPVLRDDLIFDLSKPEGTIKWVTEIDSPKLWDDLVECLERPH